MSHFSVMVVTDSEPDSEILGRVMQPYHEFECTGTDDQYVQSIDLTEEAKAGFEARSKDDNEPEENFRTWVAGWYGIEELPSPQEPDLAKKHKYGYVTIDEDGNVLKVIDRTNPNNKWDGWRVGGRYRSKLQVKDGVTSAVSSDPSYEWREEKPPEGFDSACVADIDFDKMKAAAVQARKDWAEECISKCGMSREAFSIGCSQQKESHAKWMELPPETKPRGEQHRQWLRESGYVELADALKGNWDIPETDGKSLDEWIQDAPALSSFAVLKDGNWYERGEMGWFACVRNEKQNWDEQFSELVQSLNPTQWITFLDCHI